MEYRPTAAVLIIGNEILSGRTRDANAPWLAERLAGLGIPVREIRVVPDVSERIIEAVNALRAQYTYVFTTGGIGPTHDDITTAAVAAAFGTPVERNAEAEARLRAHYEHLVDMNSARLRMADIPVGASLIDNPVSVAPGFRLDNVHVLPGVPRIMQAMFEGLAHTLAGGPPMLSVSVRGHVREGDIAEPLGALQGTVPDIDIGSYPFAQGDRIGTSLIARGTDATRLRALLVSLVELMRPFDADLEVTDLPAQG
ncbi:competence/damage-inducible protein A [Pararhodospirillum oryzae]|uniref:Molybdenum cofactor biosynthesis protein n=1 Tax=Pararhodospirillum oryzae TaxID=478448 RepID=A0A512H980_9PROT|nr:competence/damage-inducible protein A [Pararhodospirillum oryzae]GEO81968.1 molybdenum cofactor biosynthesis protein [Pararhodospirillum oryzae]